MISGTDVFVSYKAEDRSRLLPLVKALEAEGFSVWWDTHIGGGSHWRDDIQEHLDAAKCVIVAWSRRAVGHGGDFVRDEANRARKRGAYLPVRLDSSEPPLGFGEIQAISLKGWHGDRADPRFQAIAQTVRRRIRGEDIELAPLHREPRISRRALLGGGITAGVLAAAAGAWLLVKSAPANAERIAVLPFADLSPTHDQAYFSEGIAEEIRSALSRIGLRVIGRNSCEAARDLDFKSAAAKLDVATILTGSVRRTPQLIRIDAQLVGGSDGVERWAQSYDRAPGDAIKIQTDIAENVAQALSIALGQAGRAALTLGGTRDSVAQDLILQSRKLRRVGSGGAEMYRQRLALAEAAIARDPAYADAYVEKANALATLATNYVPSPAIISDELAQAEASAGRAVLVAPRFGPAHEALGFIAQSRLDFATLLRETNIAISLSPNDPDLVAFEGRSVAWFGNGEEGLQLIDRAIALDPLNGRQYRYKSEVLTFLRRYPEAVAAGRKALELAPKFEVAHQMIGDALLLLGQLNAAKAEYEALGNDDPFRLARLALLAARTRDRNGAEQNIAQLKQQAGAGASYQYGEIYAQLGDSDRAFAEFENGIKAKDAGLVYLEVDPFLDPIRKDPRYSALLGRLRFPG